MPLSLLILEADPLPTQILTSWSLPIVPFITLTVTLILYLRGWRAIHQTRPNQLPLWRAVSFVSGILSLWMTLASPIDALDDYLLAAHMIQHFILMSIAPPLIVFGAPTVPLLRSLPQILIRFPVGPLLRAHWFKSLSRFITHPVTAWLAMNIAYLAWHVPIMFELTFLSEPIHEFEHLCFFLTSITFWWVVLAPWPSQPRWPRWTMIPYLLTADIVNTVLSATLVFSGKVLYPFYAAAPRISALSPLKDQIAAGAEMWVLNSIVFLVPAVVLTVRLLTPASLRQGLSGSNLQRSNPDRSNHDRSNQARIDRLKSL